MEAEHTTGTQTSAAAGNALPTRVGKYRIDGIVGRGAVGVVYKGYDEQIDRPLAIKTLRVEVITDPEYKETALKRFALEARSAGRCLHPNIVTVFDYIEQDQAPYIVMEYVDAGTLENVINSGILLPVRQVAEIMVQLLFALGHAHGKGVVHRDIKPSNILCPSATSIKVTDFGVARFDVMGLTNPNGIGAIGTPNYMSPEQFLGRPVDHRTDIFSAGIILFQLLAGAKPFVASDVAELMRKLLNESPPALATLRPGAGPHLDPVIQRALARNPDDRFQNTDEFIDALNAAIEATTIDDGPPLDLTKISVSRKGKAGGRGEGPSQSNDDLSRTMAARLSPQTLRDLERDLAGVLGPIARVIVRNEAEKATDPEMLLSQLSSKVPIAAEATRFRDTAERTIRLDDGMAAMQRDANISPSEIDAAARALLPYVGPIAQALAARQATSAIGREDYYKRLAAAIPDAEDREKFARSFGRQNNSADE